MTQADILTRLGQPAEAPRLLEEQSTYTDDAGHRLPLPPGESFFEALPESIAGVLAYYPDRALRTQQLLALLSLLHHGRGHRGGQATRHIGAHHQAPREGMA